MVSSEPLDLKKPWLSDAKSRIIFVCGFKLELTAE